MTPAEILEEPQASVRTGERSLVVHLHEDHRPDRIALIKVEEIVRNDAPITIAFGKENVSNWLRVRAGDEQFYESIQELSRDSRVTIALRPSAQEKERDREYQFVQRHFKTPTAYCPPNGRVTPEVIAEARRWGIKKIVVPGVFAAKPYRPKKGQEEIITVTPLHRVGFGSQRFIHLDQIVKYMEEVDSFCRDGLSPLDRRERVYFGPGRVLNRALVGVNKVLLAGFEGYKQMKA